MPEGGLVVALGDRRYEVERRWCRTSGDEPLGFVSDLVVDSRGFVHVGCRGAGSPVLVFDPSGTLVRSWGRGQVADVHYMSIDEEDLILLADRDAHQVLAFDADGNLRFALGERHAPRWQAPFNHPTAASMAADGEIYVSDGYGNSVVHRFAGDGALLRTWGRRGGGDGEFTTPHCVWVDRRTDRVYVADRENDRLQIFDREGAWIAEWGDFHHPMKDLRGRSRPRLRDRPDSAHQRPGPVRRAGRAVPGGDQRRPRAVGRSGRQPLPGRASPRSR